MKKILFVLVCLSVTAVSCKKETEIGGPVTIITDYDLPQQGASKEANDRIVDIYNKYGSYILYDYEDKDVKWVQASGGSTSTLVITMGDPQYADKMLDLIGDAWLQFFPDEFLKKGGLPYRVFLADEISWDRGWTIANYAYTIFGKGITLSGMNEGLSSMSAATKMQIKNEWIKGVWDYYVANGLLTVPYDFYSESDYTVTPSNPNTPENKEALRKLGFLPGTVTADATGANLFNLEAEWFNGYNWSSARSLDLAAFVIRMLQATDEQMEQYLNNPAYDKIQKKWGILVNHYKDNYGIDVRKIANTVWTAP